MKDTLRKAIGEQKSIRAEARDKINLLEYLAEELEDGCKTVEQVRKEFNSLMGIPDKEEDPFDREPHEEFGFAD